MGYVVKEETLQTGEVTRRGPFVTEQGAAVDGVPIRSWRPVMA